MISVQASDDFRIASKYDMATVPVSEGFESRALPARREELPSGGLFRAMLFGAIVSIPAWAGIVYAVVHFL